MKGCINAKKFARCKSQLRICIPRDKLLLASSHRLLSTNGPSMFDERVLDNLDVLDHLQLYGSTVKVADLMGLSQSSCSRRYRALSDLFDLGVETAEVALILEESDLSG